MLLWLPWRAAATPRHEALVAPGGLRLSYAELHARADDTARRLATLGASAGDRVALLLPNGVHFAAATHAIMRLGAVLLPLNLRLTPAELAWQVEDVGARLLVCDARTLAAAAELRGRVAGLRAVCAGCGDGLADGSGVHGWRGDGSHPVDDECGRLPASGERDVHAPPVQPLAHVHPAPDAALRDRAGDDEPLAVIHTSGTTGTPKGAILTHANFWASAMGSALNLGLHADDRWLAPLPLFHVGGLSVLTRSAIYGTTAVLHDGFDAARVSNTIDAERISLVSLVPTMLARLLDARGNRPFPAHLRCVLLGGGPAPRPLLERCAALGVPVAQTYGMTETSSQVATLAPADALRKLGSVGRALYPTELRVVHGDGTDAPAGEAGEIVVRGPTVTPGYWNRPDATRQAIVDGWLHTGDVGTLDDEGYLHVLDRRDDLIVTGGENVYPAEVEGALLAHPGVAEAVVVGIPDPEWGQRVVALVRLVDGGEAVGGGETAGESLRAFCAGRIARYKVPVEVSTTHDPLPRNAGGKLLRRVVRERWGVRARG